MALRARMASPSLLANFRDCEPSEHMPRTSARAHTCAVVIGRASCVPRSREHQKRPAAGRQKKSHVQKEHILQRSSEYQYQSSGLNDSPVRVVFEDSSPQGTWGVEMTLSPTRPQRTWRLKGLGPASFQGTQGAKNTESRQSTGYLGAKRTESRQSPGYLVAKRTESRQSTGYLGAERT